MRDTDSIHAARPAAKIRRDGWTAARQIAFLDALAATRCIAAAASAAGMSRESAYRLRARHPHGLFAALWRRNLALAEPHPKGHSQPLGNGRLARLLGNHFRRQSGEFAVTGKPQPPPLR